MEIFEQEWEGRKWIGSKGFHAAPEKLENFFSSLQGEEKLLFDRICGALPCAKEYMAENYKKFGWDKDIFDMCTLFVPSALPKPVPFFEKPWSCYENSFKMAEEKGLLYIEGLAINPAGPDIHAWNSSDGVDVIDYTWPYQHVNKYFGVPLDIAHLKKHGYLYGGLLGKMLADHREKFKQAAA